jgi:hypothetical protein
MSLDLEAIVAKEIGACWEIDLRAARAVAKATLDELQQRINLNMSPGVQGDPDIEKGEPIINVGLKNALRIVEEVKNKICASDDTKKEARP